MSFRPADDDNPFAPPRSLIGDRSLSSGFEIDTEAEQIRRYHLSHEASIKSVGLLCYLAAMFGLLFTFGGVLSATGVIKGNPPPNSSPEMYQLTIWLGTAVWAMVTAISISQGYGLRSLQAWARWITMVLSVLSLLFSLVMALVVLMLLGGNNAVPVLIVLLVGVAILAYVFYLLVAPKSNMVFSGEYRQIIEKTPEIVCQTSLIVKILIGLVMALLVLALLGLIAASFR
jgi:hypothetical protein